MIYIHNAIADIQLYDWLVIAIFVFCLISCIIIGQTYKTKYNAEDFEKIYIDRKTTWLRANMTWYLINFVLIVLNFLCPVIVLYISITEDIQSAALLKQKIIVYSALGLLSQLITFALNPSKTAFGYREAYRTLESVFMETRSMPRERSEPKLCEALIVGEEYISNAMFLTFSLKSVEPISIIIPQNTDISNNEDSNHSGEEKLD